MPSDAKKKRRKKIEEKNLKLSCVRRRWHCQTLENNKMPSKRIYYYYYNIGSVFNWRSMLQAKRQHNFFFEIKKNEETPNKLQLICMRTTIKFNDDIPCKLIAIIIVFFFLSVSRLMGSGAGGSMSHVSNMGSLAACSVTDTKPMQFPLSQRRKRRVLFTQHQVSDVFNS